MEDRFQDTKSDTSMNAKPRPDDQVSSLPAELAFPSYLVFPSRRLLLFNSPAAEEYNWRQPESIGQPLEEILVRSWSPRLFSVIDEVIREGESRYVDLSVPMPSGSWITRNALVAPAAHHGKKAALVIMQLGSGASGDTKNTQGSVESRTEPSETIMVKNRVIDTAIAPIAVAHLDGRLAYANQALLDLWGLPSRRDAVGRHVFEFWKDPQTAQDLVDEMTENETASGELTGRTWDGRNIEVRVNAAMVRNADGDPIAMAASFLDLSKERALLHEQEFLAGILKGVSECVIATDLDGIITYWNPGAEKLFGYHSAEAQGRDIRQIIVPAQGESQDNIIDRVRTQGHWDGKMLTRRKDGYTFWQESYISLIEDSSGNAIGLVGINHDITREMEREQANQELLRRVRTLHYVDNALLRQDSPESIAETALRSLSGILNCRRTSVALIDELTRLPYIFYEFPEPDLPLDARPGFLSLAMFGPAPLDPDQGMNIVEHVQPLFDADPDRAWLAQTGVRAYINIQLVAEHRVIGFLNVGTTDPSELTEEAISICEELAASLSVAIHHSLLLRKERRAADQIRQLARRRTSIEQQERTRLGRILHDAVGNGLAVLSVKLTQLDNKVAAGEQESAIEVSRSARRQVAELGKTVREVIEGVRPAVLEELGFIAAVEEYAGKLSLRSHIAVEIDSSTRSTGLSAAAQTELYFVVVELLSNVVKHAKASRITLAIRESSGRFGIRLADDGKGFDVLSVVTRRSSTGWGLINVRERVEALGGTMAVHSQPGEGTAVTLEIPTEGHE